MGRFSTRRRLTRSVCYIYFCQQLDKSTLSFAAVFNIQADAHLVGQDYSWLSSIVYFAQLVFQPRESKSRVSVKTALIPVSVWALVKIPVDIWICGCFTGWSVMLCIMAAMTNFAGLAAMQFLLGAFEASIAPSMIIITSMWWTRREQPLRSNMWYSMNVSNLWALLHWIQT